MNRSLFSFISILAITFVLSSIAVSKRFVASNLEKASSKQWGPIQTLVAGLGNESIKSAMNEKGDVLAVWIHNSSEPNQKASNIIYSSFFSSQEGKWGTPQQIENPLFENWEYHLYLTMDKTGDAFLAWVAKGKVWIKAYHLGSGWENAISLTGDLSGQVIHPGMPIIFPEEPGESLQIKMNREGDAAILWFQSNQKECPLHFSTYSKLQNRWSAPIKVSENECGGNADFSLNSDGELFITWVQTFWSDTGHKQSHDKIHSKLCSVSSVECKSLPVYEDISESLSGFDKIIVLKSLNQNEQLVYLALEQTHLEFLQYNEENKNWSHPLLINEAYKMPDSALQLSSNEQGKAFALWREEYHGDTLFAGYYDPNTGWGPKQLLSRSEKFIGVPSVQMNENQAVAAWLENTEFNYYSVLVKTYSTNLGWSQKATLLSKVGTECGKPILAMNARGNRMAIWKQKNKDGSESIVSRSMKGFE